MTYDRLEENQCYHIQIVGIYYTGNGNYISQLPPKTILELRPEPHNKYDKYAVSVWHDNHKLGYLPKGKNIPFFNSLDEEDYASFPKSNIICLLGCYIPSFRKNTSHSGRKYRFQPERADITISTYITQIEWRPAVFLPEDLAAY